MYPNYQANSYQQQHSSQYNPNFVPSQPNYLQPQHQPPFLNIPQNQNNRAVFSSMIQPLTNSPQTPKSAGLNRLQSMGRFIKQQPEPTIKVSEPAFQNNPTPNLNFRNLAAQKPKMSSSVIFAKGSDEQLNRFPTFGVEGTGTSKLQSLMYNKNRGNEAPKQMFLESSEDKRKKEIDTIKEDMNKINKKIENFTFKKSEDGSGQSKPYFQLATRKASNPNQQNSVQSSSGDGNLGFFKNYSNNTSTNTSVSNSPNASEVYKQEIQQLNPNPQEYGKQPIKLQHSFSANELSRPEFTKRQQNTGGMFKKKNAYIGNESAEGAQRTFALSPRAHLKLAQKSPEHIKVPEVTEFKAAEVVGVASPKKSLKRIESINTEVQSLPSNFSSSSSASKDYGLRQFKKSDFAIGKKMGKGQFGEVMLVQHKATGFLCGLKVMSKKQIREQKYENQVARQLAIQFFLAHRNVAPLYGYFSDQQNVYLLVEFCTNGQLLQLLRKAHRMEEAECSPIIREICQGLDYIHKQQIIHRDIKPQNILFNFNTVKICDFGWAVYSGNGMRKTVAGSPLYYSPQVVLQTKYDEKIDIWAIGMMTYECLLGKIPFRIYSQLDLNRIVEDQIKFPEYIDVSEEAKDFILKICKKNPDDRMEMREILRHPFITKYLKEKKVGNDVLEEFRKVLN